LRLAVENGLKTIAFPCISTGVYRYPKLEAARIAFREITRFLAVYPGFEQVIIVCFGPEDFNIYNRLLAEGPEA
jgi:appr-1-p processing enzyme domain protein